MVACRCACAVAAAGGAGELLVGSNVDFGFVSDCFGDSFLEYSGGEFDLAGGESGCGVELGD